MTAKPTSKTEAATIRSEFYTKLQTTRSALRKVYDHHETFDSKDLVLEIGDIKNSPSNITHATVQMNETCDRFSVKFYRIQGASVTSRKVFNLVRDTDIRQLFLDQIGLNL